MSESAPILQASGLAFAYGDRPAVSQVDISLNRGEVVSVLGPNGSGKSTLLKILLGHLRARGEVLWNSRRVEDWSRRQLGRVVAYLPQNPTIDEGETVDHVLALGRAPYWGPFGLESAADLGAILAVSEQLQIETLLLHRRLDELSGGQRQRVFIARCLVQQPQALLLDEPANNLDLRYQIQVLELLRKLAREQNLAILMTVHDVNLAAEFSDRLILLQDGQKLADGPPASILRAELLEQLYGLPMELLDRPGRNPVVMPVGR